MQLCSDSYGSPYWHLLEQLHHITVAHPYAPDRPRLPHFDRVRTAMNVDVPLHRIHFPQTISTHLAPRQPQYASEYPVAIRKAPGEFRRPNLSCRAAPDEDSVHRLPRSDFGAHDVLAAWGAETPSKFARAIARSGDGVAPKLPPVLGKYEALLQDGDFNFGHAAAPKRIPIAAGPLRSRERRP